MQPAIYLRFCRTCERLFYTFRKSHKTMCLECRTKTLKHRKADLLYFICYASEYDNLQQLKTALFSDINNLRENVAERMKVVQIAKLGHPFGFNCNNETMEQIKPKENFKSHIYFKRAVVKS